MDKKESPDALREKFDGIAAELVKARKSSPGAEVQDTAIAERTYKSLSKSMKQHGKKMVDASEEQQHIYETVIRDTFDFIGNDHVDAKMYQSEMLELLHKASALPEKSNSPEVTEHLKEIIKAQIHTSKEDRIGKRFGKALDIASLAFFSPAFAAGLDVIGDSAKNLLKGGLFRSEETNKINAAETRGQADRDLMGEGIDTAFQSDSIKSVRKRERNREEFGTSGDREFDSNTSHSHKVNDGGVSAHSDSSVDTMNVDTLIVKNVVMEDGKSSSSSEPNEKFNTKVSEGKTEAKVEPRTSDVIDVESVVKSESNHPTEGGNSSYKTKKDTSISDVVPKPIKIPQVASSDIIEAAHPIRKSKNIKKSEGGITDIIPKIIPKTPLIDKAIGISQKILGQRNEKPAAKQYESEDGISPTDVVIGGGLAVGAAVVGTGVLADYGMGKLGIGGHDEMENRTDDQNWNKMSTAQKIQSGAARTIEGVGDFVGLTNVSNEAKAQRVKKESEYFGTTARNIDPSKFPETFTPPKKKESIANVEPVVESKPTAFGEALAKQSNQKIQSAEITPIDVANTVEKAKNESLVKTQALQKDIDEKANLQSKNDQGNKAPVIIDNSTSNTTQPSSKTEETTRPAHSRDNDSTFKRWQDNSFFK